MNIYLTSRVWRLVIKKLETYMWGNLVHVFIVGITTCSLTRGWPGVTAAKRPWD